MTEYVKVIANGKTIFVPTDQPAVPVPPKAQPTPQAPYAKRIGKKYCERKNWW